MKYTLEEIENLARQSVYECAIDLTCENCGCENRVEPDGECDCEECGKPITNPLKAAGLI